MTRCLTANLKPSNASRYLSGYHDDTGVWILPYIARLQMSVTSFENQNQTVRYFSLRFKFIHVLKALCLDIQLRQASIFSVTFSLVGSGLMVKNIVPEDSEIMIACKAGDVSTVWGLLQSRKASVHDMTPDFLPPLRVRNFYPGLLNELKLMTTKLAIASGSLELVTLLLNNGADIKCGYGKLQTYIYQFPISSFIVDFIQKPARVRVPLSPNRNCSIIII